MWALIPARQKKFRGWNKKGLCGVDPGGAGKEAGVTQDMIDIVGPMIPSLRRYARALLRDPAAADDLVQDTLERAIGRWHQRRDDASTRAWLLTILHNLAVNMMRRNSRRGGTIAIDAVDEAVMATAPTQEAGLAHNDVLRAIAQLPEDQRALLLLMALEDVSYAEAATIIGVPVGTVMSRLSRGRERLRRLLAETGESAARPMLRSVK